MRWLLILCLLLPPVYAVEISEVMYNPLGLDSDREFVEVYGIDNLTGFVFGDLKENASLKELFYFPGNFSLIVPVTFNYTGLNVSIYTPGSQLGNGLGNSGDSLFLYFNGTLVSSVNYTGTFGNGDGYSIEFLNDTVSSSIVLGGTPGYFYETVEELHEEQVCTPEFFVDLSSLVVNLSDSLAYTFDVVGVDVFIVEYWVRGVGGVVKAPRNTTSLTMKSFTPQDAGLYYVEARLYSSCGDLFVSSPFFVSGTLPEEVTSSSTKDEVSVVAEKIPSQPFSVSLLEQNLTFIVNTTTSVFVNVSAGSTPVSGRLWIYVYSSSVSLSGERGANAVLFSLDSLDSEVFSFPVTPTRFKDSARLMVKWQKEGLVSVSQFYAPIVLLDVPVFEELSENYSVVSETVNATTLINSDPSPLTGHVVYEAPQVRLQHLGLILGCVVAFGFVLLGFMYFGWRLWSLRHVQS